MINGRPFPLPPHALGIQRAKEPERGRIFAQSLVGKVQQGALEMAGAAVQKDPFMNDPLEPSLTASNEPQLPIGCIGAETHAAPEQIIVTAQIITIQGVRQRQECPDLRLEVRTKALIRVKQ